MHKVRFTKSFSVNKWKRVLMNTFMAAPLFMSALDANSDLPSEIKSFLSESCISCHGNEKHKGDINFEAETKREDIVKNYKLWEAAAEQVEISEMPPKKKKQPSDSSKAKFITWVNGVLSDAAKKNANDPGQVVMRRLNRQELENTLYDLTNLKFDLSHRLPADAGGGEGFTNMGAALFLSPNHLEAYLDIFENVADKSAILPHTGIRFYEQEIGDRNYDAIKDEVARGLRERYESIVGPHMPNNFEDQRIKDYILAAWMFKNKEVFGVKTLVECAEAFDLQSIYLENWWVYLNSSEPKSKYLDYERVPFKSLPKATSSDLTKIPPEVHRIVDKIKEDRKKWYKVQRPQQDSNAYQNYSASLDLKKTKYFTLMVTDAADGNKGDVVIWRDLTVKHKINKKPWNQTVPLKKYLENQLAVLKENKELDESQKKKFHHLNSLVVKFGEGFSDLKVKPNELVLKAGERMVFPVIKDSYTFRGKSVMWTKGPDLQKASAQQVFLNHAHWGKVPSLVPGFRIVYDSAGTAKGPIWREFVPMREIFGDEKFRRMFRVQENYFKKPKLPIVYYMSRDQVMALLDDKDRTYFEAMHEDYYVIDKFNPSHLAWRAKKAPKLKDGTPNFEKYSKKQMADYESTKKWMAGYEKKTKELVEGHLLKFAEKAWRRPLSEIEKNEINENYKSALSKNSLFEPAAREVMQRILLSPNFIFKVEKAKKMKEHALSQHELANRLSYTLWATMPDHKLIESANKGQLSDWKTLDGHMKRMLKDKKSTGLAEQFGGEWLEFRDFSLHTGLDKNAFPRVTNKVQTLMEEESRTFFAKMIQEDKSVLDIFLSDETFLNEELANYYGIKNVKGSEFRAVKVKDYQRGGLFGMGAMLVKTSYPLRTSPVLRGDYLLETILGHYLPAPPDDVPDLSEVGKKSTKPMSVREQLEIHRLDANCASCHDKIDPLGFALEGFGPDGMRRLKDNGQLIDDSGEMRGSKPFKGLSGLKVFLKAQENDLLKQVSQKFLGYALGREVEIGDRDLIEKMVESLKKNQLKFSAMVRPLIHSKVFKTRRGKDGAA